MKKRFMSAFLAVIMLFSMLSTTAFAASSEEEALGEINIFNGGVTMSYSRCRTVCPSLPGNANRRGGRRR